MSTQKDKDQRICLSDLLHIFSTSKKLLAIGIAIFALLALLWAIRAPVRYYSQGSFKDSGKVRSGVPDAFASLAHATGAIQSDSAAIAIIKSKTVLSQVAAKLALQGSIYPVTSTWSIWHMLQGELATMKDNLKVEYALLRNSSVPALTEIANPIIFQAVEYDGETPLTFSLLFEADGSYTLRDEKFFMAGGRLSEPFFGHGFQFTLALSNQGSLESLQGQKFTLHIQPMSKVVEALMAATSVEADRNGKNILIIRIYDRNRFQAANLVNTLMETYRIYSINDDRKVMDEQIAYLHQRQGQISEELKNIMAVYAQRCSNELSGSGFPDVETQIGFFVASHQDYHNKLFTIELERSRLQIYLDAGYVYYDRYSSEGDPIVINKLLEKIRELKQQSDTLELALSGTPVTDEDQLEKGLSQQLLQLEQARQSKRSLETLLESVEQGFLATATIPDSLLHNPRYLIAMWMKRLQESQQRWLVAPPEQKGLCQEEWQQCKMSFISYLHNLLRLLEVYINNVEERVVRHQDHPIEARGLDLEAAWELYNVYTKKLSELEAQLLQGEFIAEQLQDPDFEVSSLSGTLEDGVSEQLFTEASTLVLNLHDQANRSQKEILRLKEELAQQKEFIIIHLKQMLQVWTLNKKTLIEKIHSLQGLLRELIQMQLTVLQKHLDEYVLSRLSNLEQDQQVIERRQRQLRSQMADLPVKLIEKRLIDHQIAIDRMMIEEMMKLVESKNISSHLEVMQSAPLDDANLPLHPRSCKPLLCMFLGAIFGTCVMAAIVLARQMMQGPPTTVKALQSQEQIVAGVLKLNEALFSEKLSELSYNQKEVVRSLVQILCPIAYELPKTVLIMQGPVRGLSEAFAALLAIRSEQSGKSKVLWVELDGDELHKGLGAYLEADQPIDAVQASEGYDKVFFGKALPSAAEFVLTARFTKWLQLQQERYDYVICSSNAQNSSSWSHGLAGLFSCKGIVVQNQPLEQLQPWFLNPSLRQNGRQLAFVLIQ